MNINCFTLLHALKLRYFRSVSGIGAVILLLLLCLLLLWTVIILLILTKRGNMCDSTVLVNKTDKEQLHLPLKPKTEYELLRRRVRSNTLELFDYIQFALTELKKNSQENDSDNYIDNVISISREHKNAIISDMDRLRENDGYESWREDEARDLSELMHRRIEYLQNPKNCSQAKKLLCRISKWVTLFTILLFVIIKTTSRT